MKENAQNSLSAEDIVENITKDIIVQDKKFTVNEHAAMLGVSGNYFQTARDTIAQEHQLELAEAVEVSAKIADKTDQLDAIKTKISQITVLAQNTDVFSDADILDMNEKLAAAKDEFENNQNPTEALEQLNALYEARVEEVKAYNAAQEKASPQKEESWLKRKFSKLFGKKKAEEVKVGTTNETSAETAKEESSETELPKEETGLNAAAIAAADEVIKEADEAIKEGEAEKKTPETGKFAMKNIASVQGGAAVLASVGGLAMLANSKDREQAVDQETGQVQETTKPNWFKRILGVAVIVAAVVAGIKIGQGKDWRGRVSAETPNENSRAI